MTWLALVVSRSVNLRFFLGREEPSDAGKCGGPIEADFSFCKAALPGFARFSLSDIDAPGEGEGECAVVRWAVVRLEALEDAATLV